MIPIPSTMKAPGDHRHGIWRGGVLQVKVTNACDLDCVNCSVGVGLAKKLRRTFHMTPDQFRQALRSLRGYTGVIGMFGGNPCIHPRFEELCAIFREEVPNQDQRGLWSNHPRGKGAICRATFSPTHSNLNVHQVQAAWDEFKRDWPEAKLLPLGLSAPSYHGPLFGAMTDVGYTEEEMWRAVGRCYVNQAWSAEITVVDGKLLAYFCEVAATQAELSGDGSLGMEPAPGWWRRPMADFESQVRVSCPRCLIPMNPRKVDAAGDAPEEFTAVWAPTFLTISGRPMRQVTDRAEIAGGDPATRYLKAGVMPAGFKA